MAFRGRGRGGRGRGRFGTENRFCKNEPFILFPEGVELPDIPKVSMEDQVLIKRKFLLESFWKGSCYHLTEDVLKSKKPDTEIERYSDTLKQDNHKRREKLASYLKLTSSNFPPELIQGTKRIQHEQKKLRWDRDTYDKKLDFFENLENIESSKDFLEGDDPKEKKENSDNEDADRPEEDDEETSDDGDYNQNVDFDDDDDDLNIDDEETEDVYE